MLPSHGFRRQHVDSVTRMLPTDSIEKPQIKNERGNHQHSKTSKIIEIHREIKKWHRFEILAKCSHFW